MCNNLIYIVLLHTFAIGHVRLICHIATKKSCIPLCLWLFSNLKRHYATVTSIQSNKPRCNVACYISWLALLVMPGPALDHDVPGLCQSCDLGPILGLDSRHRLRLQLEVTFQVRILVIFQFEPRPGSRDSNLKHPTQVSLSIPGICWLSHSEVSRTGRISNSG